MSRGVGRNQRAAHQTSFRYSSNYWIESGEVPAVPAADACWEALGSQLYLTQCNPTAPRGCPPSTRGAFARPPKAAATATGRRKAFVGMPQGHRLHRCLPPHVVGPARIQTHDKVHQLFLRPVRAPRAGPCHQPQGSCVSPDVPGGLSVCRQPECQGPADRQRGAGEVGDRGRTARHQTPDRRRGEPDADGGDYTVSEASRRRSFSRIRPRRVS